MIFDKRSEACYKSIEDWRPCSSWASPRNGDTQLTGIAGQVAAMAGLAIGVTGLLYVFVSPLIAEALLICQTTRDLNLVLQVLDLVVMRRIFDKRIFYLHMNEYEIFKHTKGVQW